MLHSYFRVRSLFLAGAAALILTLVLALSTNGASAAAVETAVEPLSEPPGWSPAPPGQASNRPPYFIEGQNDTSLTMDENYGPITDLPVLHAVKDPDGDKVTVSKAGADAARFTLGHVHSWGGADYYALKLHATPDFENPDDANGDGVYEITLQASDASSTTELAITLTVRNVNEPPVITGLGAVDFAEHSGTNVGLYTAADPEGKPTTLTLGGTDASSFTFTNSTLAFSAVPDYETKNSYSVTFTASDTRKNATLPVTITITDVDEATAVTLNGQEMLSVAENSGLSLATYTAQDPEGGAITWSLEGSDKDLFTLSGGALSFDESPDYETKSLYAVTVKAAAGSKSAVRNVTVTVEDVNEPPVISGGGSVSVTELHSKTDPVKVLTATDPEGDTITWSLSGTDAEDFSISDVGALTFVAQPDYEAPADSNGDNIYRVTVHVTAEGGADSTAVTVTVLDSAVEQVTISGGATASIDENTTGDLLTLTAEDGGASSSFDWSLQGNPAGFSISGGVLSVSSGLDHEAGATRVVTVLASNGHYTGSHTVTVTVTDVNEPPAIDREGWDTAKEEGTSTAHSFGAAVARDPEGDELTWSLTGTDADSFYFDEYVSRDERGNVIRVDIRLYFKVVPDYETPRDDDGDNIYNFTVNVADAGGSDSMAMTTEVIDVPASREAMVISGATTASIDENTTGDLLTLVGNKLTASSSIVWSLEGDFPDFSIDDGTISVVSGLDYEEQATYSLTVRAWNDTHTHKVATHTVAVTVTDVNEPPVISGGGSVSVTELHSKTDPVKVLTATDPEGDTITWSLSGTDAEDFSISDVGALTFVAQPDYEAPADSNGDNIYRVTVHVTAEGGADSTAVTVTVLDSAVEQVTISGGATASIDENTTGDLLTLTAEDGGASSSFDWSLQGNPAGFSISGGVLSVSSGLDHEAGATRVVTVLASNGHYTGSHTVTVTVTDVNEPPVVSGRASFARQEHISPGNENILLETYRATDPEGDAITWSLSGTDSDDFIITTDGELRIKADPNYESPTDSDRDNIYHVNVDATATGGTGSMAVKFYVHDKPATLEPTYVTGPTSATIAENTAGHLGTFTASSEVGGPFTWGLYGDDSGMSISNGRLAVTDRVGL